VNNIIFTYVLIIITFYLINTLLIKKNLLIDSFQVNTHKNLVNQKAVPISGGILLVCVILFLFKDTSIINKFLFFLIFFLGFLSDTKKLSSPTYRLIVQIFISGLYVFINDFYAVETQIYYFDQLLNNYLFVKLFFTVFCILILINGTNFIDGVNTLASGYFLVVIINILLINHLYGLEADFLNISYIFSFLIIFFIFNFFSKSFLGDGGSYLLGFLLGIYLINYNIINKDISPYYIILILWYPAFENLFTIFRRIFYDKKKVKNPDNLHLHQLIFIYLNKKFSKKKHLNTLTGVLINTFNFMVFFIGSFYIYSSYKILVILLFLVISYLIIYFLLRKFYNNINI
jgi:UDP-N-acetylmuramyl pentapeptide phosphotransferase/UDP-N-acetylglucosamine-1-phosphate transferase|tara:strand:- start:481 stop:1515 length:1035 start_codon:yes stop_codon:yes gene_type:complete